VPGVNGPSSEYLVSQLQGIQSQLTALAQQSSYVVVDQNLKLRVVVGLLPSGDFGILLQDPAGNTQELLPALSSYVNGTLSTTSSTAASIAGSPSITANIGASGDCELTVAAYINVPAGALGTVFIVADGGAAWSLTALDNFNGSAALSASVCGMVKWKQRTAGSLTPGSHAFTLKYATTAGTANFSQNYFKVQPV
jgi:hypothetical protein